MHILASDSLESLDTIGPTFKIFVFADPEFSGWVGRYEKIVLFPVQEN